MPLEAPVHTAWVSASSRLLLFRTCFSFPSVPASVHDASSEAESESSPPFARALWSLRNNPPPHTQHATPP
jgi:hypothetical protein